MHILNILLCIFLHSFLLVLRWNRFPSADICTKWDACMGRKRIITNWIKWPRNLETNAENLSSVNNSPMYKTMITIIWSLLNSLCEKIEVYQKIVCLQSIVHHNHWTQHIKQASRQSCTKRRPLSYTYLFSAAAISFFHEYFFYEDFFCVFFLQK